MLDRFTWFKQAAYLWRGEGLTVYIDPWEVTTEDIADLVLITHAHPDHFSPDDIEKVRGSHTRIVAPRDIANELKGNVTPVAPGQSHQIAGVSFETVPAYNVVEERLEAHPKANGWVGYLLQLAGTTYYHAGDTDRLPELESLHTDVAFVPIGGTYTMDVGEAAGLVKAMKPPLAVPMHYGFVVGSESDGDQFAADAQPVPVQIMKPVHPFER